MHQSRAEATTSRSTLSPPWGCALGGSTKTVGLCTERGEALVESIQAQQNSPPSRLGEREGRGFPTARTWLPVSPAQRMAVCVCEAHPGSAAWHLHTSDPSPCMAVPQGHSWYQTSFSWHPRDKDGCYSTAQPAANGPRPGQGAASHSPPGAAPALPSEGAGGGSVSSSATRSQLPFSTLLALLLERQPG